MTQAELSALRTQAVAMGCTSIRQQHTQTLDGPVKIDARDPDGFFIRVDHPDPAVCMGLIEQYGLAFSECDTRHLYDKPDTLWRAVCRDGSGYGESKVLAKAVARCVISMRLGDEFECPDELGVV